MANGFLHRFYSLHVRNHNQFLMRLPTLPVTSWHIMSRIDEELSVEEFFFFHFFSLPNSPRRVLKSDGLVKPFALLPQVRVHGFLSHFYIVKCALWSLLFNKWFLMGDFPSGMSMNGVTSNERYRHEPTVNLKLDSFPDIQYDQPNRKFFRKNNKPVFRFNRPRKFT